MKNLVVAKRYAQALFEVANGKGSTDAVEQELKAFTTALKDNPKMVDLLNNPSIETGVKKQQVTSLLQGRVSDIVLNFIQLLIDRRRQDTIESIYTEYVRLADEARGQIKATVETAVPLSEEELSVLKSKLGDASKVELKATVNPSLIGGARVRVGDRVFDYTVAGQLERFRQTLNH